MPRPAVTLIVNENAGGMLDGSLKPGDVAQRIMDAGLDVDLLTGRPADLTDRVRLALASPATVVAIAGGDGTLNAAAQLLAGSEKVLAIIPLGTLNHLARDLGIPSDLEGAVDVLCRGEPVDIDIGDVNGYAFLCSSMIGFTSRLAGQREYWRGRLHPWTWVRVFTRIAKTLYRDPRVEIQVTDPAYPAFRTRHLTVAVGGYGEEPGRLFHRASLDAGCLGVYAIRSPTVIRLLRIFAAALIGRWRRAPEITTLESRALLVDSSRPRLRVMNDGEISLIDVPLRYRVRERGLRVLRPRQPQDPDSGHGEAVTA